MFAKPSSQAWTRQRKLTSTSLALHGVVLVWLLHAPAPQLLTPSSVALGPSGRAIAPLYWPTGAPRNSKTSSASSATAANGPPRLTNEKQISRRTPKSPKAHAQRPVPRPEKPHPTATT